MRTKHVLLSTVLTAAITLPLFGQHNLNDTTKTDMKRHDMSSMMGKPTTDATVEGLHMKVWLMTQKQHKKMMNGKMGQFMRHGEKEGEMQRMEMGEMKDTSMTMNEDMKGMKHHDMAMQDSSMAMNKDMKSMKHDGMGMDKATKKAMMAGTHCIMLNVTDAASDKEIANASAKVLIVSPSKKNFTVDLMPMMSHFGDGLTLDEKGEYQFTVSVDVGGVSKMTQFQYMVK